MSPKFYLSELVLEVLLPHILSFLDEASCLQCGGTSKIRHRIVTTIVLPNRYEAEVCRCTYLRERYLSRRKAWLKTREKLPAEIADRLDMELRNHFYSFKGEKRLSYAAKILELGSKGASTTVFEDAEFHLSNRIVERIIKETVRSESSLQVLLPALATLLVIRRNEAPFNDRLEADEQPDAYIHYMLFDHSPLNATTIWYSLVEEVVAGAQLLPAVGWEWPKRCWDKQRLDTRDNLRKAFRLVWYCCYNNQENCDSILLPRLTSHLEWVGSLIEQACHSPSFAKQIDLSNERFVKACLSCRKARRLLIRLVKLLGETSDIPAALGFALCKRRERSVLLKIYDNLSPLNRRKWVDARNEHGNCMLLVACDSRGRSERLVSELLQRGWDPRRTNKQELSAFDLARLKRNKKVIETLEWYMQHQGDKARASAQNGSSCKAFKAGSKSRNYRTAHPRTSRSTKTANV